MNYSIDWLKTRKKNNPLRYWIERLGNNDLLTFIVAIIVIAEFSYLLIF